MIKNLIDLLYPRTCPICGNVVVPKTNYACEDCKGSLNYINEPRCKKCSKPIENEEQEYCYDCCTHSFHYTEGRALWIYNKTVQNSIIKFKYKSKKEYCDFYVNELVKHYGGYIKDKNISLLVPIPVHHTKLKERGYNQAELIAKGVGKELNIPVGKGLLKRNKKTLPQKELSDRERLKNLEQAFSFHDKDNIFYENIDHVMLVDDIYTTGSTIEACTKILLANGVHKVYFISLCIGKGF